MKITLTDGTVLNPVVVIGERRYTQGAYRDSLRFVFDAGMYDVVDVDSAFSAENCERITIEGEEGAVYIHKSYTVRAELLKAPVQVQEATEETEAVYEDRVIVTMAQRTAQENQVAEMAAAMNALLNGEG